MAETQYSNPSGGGGGDDVVYNTGSASPQTLKAWASNQDCLDVYMVNAFYLGTAQRTQYFMSLWKTATCLGLQFYGAWILMQQQYTIYQGENGSCSSEISGNVAFIGFLFATYITLVCTEQIRSLNRYGMYGYVDIIYSSLFIFAKSHAIYYVVGVKHSQTL